ncbi:hypothetical protein WJX84_008733 [Apatococcus fuscideae]|uniref:Coenzyme Q-binding protein COQ10 START domain-containing protein n=1 Tax=Apatococcus fuscideae TaxID=2026836 RepID=A0AAW1TH01_9CHLO
MESSNRRRTIFNFPAADESKKYTERKLIGYSPQQLYTVVAGIEHYKDFVPWCVRSSITHQPSADYLEAELEVGFKLFTERYTSKVTLHKPNKVFSAVADSTLFDHLDSTWEFHKGPTPTTTWLTFGVDFAFKSPLYKHVATVFFDEVVKRMMNAFETRCRALYGPSHAHRPAPQHRPIAA